MRKSRPTTAKRDDGTDYSAGRATPLDREVRTAHTRELAYALAERWIEENVKKGWVEVGV